MICEFYGLDSVRKVTVSKMDNCIRIEPGWPKTYGCMDLTLFESERNDETSEIQIEQGCTHTFFEK